MAYIQLAVAIVLAVAGDTAMKLSKGLSKIWWAIPIGLAYAAAIYLQSLVMEELPLGFVYAVWNACQIGIVAAVGAIVFHEGWNRTKTIGLGLLIVGVVLLELGKGM